MEIVLETKRLILREVTVSDIEVLYLYFSDPRLYQFSTVRDIKGTKAWIEWTLESYRDNGFGKWIMMLKENESVIGDCGISLQKVNGKTYPEIGYRLVYDSWGMGFASEAALGCRDYGFDTLRFSKS